MTLIFFCFYSGDILVFLTGQDEIESLAKLVTDCAQHCGSGEVAISLSMWILEPGNVDTKMKCVWKKILKCKVIYAKSQFKATYYQSHFLSEEIVTSFVLSTERHFMVHSLSDCNFYMLSILPGQHHTFYKQLWIHSTIANNALLRKWNPVNKTTNGPWNLWPY